MIRWSMLSRLSSCCCLVGSSASLIVDTSHLHNIKGRKHGLPFQKLSLADKIEISDHVKKSKQTSKQATELQNKSTKSLVCDRAFQ